MTKNILVRNHVNVIGNGAKPILFAPGFGCSQNMWRFVAPAFKQDYRIILFDYAGAGSSDLQSYDFQKYSSLQGYAQDVLDVCKALDLQDVIFIGHSVGCMIGLLASIQEPDRFERIIMLGPSPRYLNDPSTGYIGGFDKEDLEGLMEIMDKNYIGWADYLAPIIMKNTDRMELTTELKESFCSTDPVIARQFAMTTFFSDNRADLPKVPVPSLILQCTNDSIAPTQVGEYIHAHMPNSTLRFMKATGHCPHMSHPEETIQLIQEYLAVGSR